LARIDHYSNPNAPAANTARIGAAAAAFDDQGRLLMVRRADNGNWTLPGGAKELDESLPGAAEREALEETGLEVQVTDLVGVYSDPQHRIEYEQGTVVPECALVFTARITGGTLAHDEECTEVRFVEHSELDDLPMHESQRLRVEHAFTRHSDPSLLPHLG
jgi:ADP-ribose pyrophosphatase YjhB (NUDIX family)